MSGDVVDFDPAVFGADTFTTIDVVLGALPQVAQGVSVISNHQVALDGSALVAGEAGLVLDGGNTVYGLEVRDSPGDGVRIDGPPPAGPPTVLGDPTRGMVLIGNRLSGVRVSGATAAGVSIEGNWIGTDLTGALSGNCAVPATGACAGVLVDDSNTAPVVVDGNVVVDTRGVAAISQGVGVLLCGGSNHVVTNNHVGLLQDDTAAGNAGPGVQVTGASVSAVTVSGNTIGSNGGSGVLLGIGLVGAWVSANHIGVDTAGAAARPNGYQGVKILGSDGHQLEDNVISGNTGSGVRRTAPTGRTGTPTGCSSATGSAWTPPAATRSQRHPRDSVHRPGGPVPDRGPRGR